MFQHLNNVIPAKNPKISAKVAAEEKEKKNLKMLEL